MGTSFPLLSCGGALGDTQFVLMSLIKLLLDVLISGVTPRVPGGRYAVSMKLESES